MSKIQDENQLEKFKSHADDQHEFAVNLANFIMWRENKFAELGEKLPVLRHRIRAATPRAWAMQEYAGSINDAILGESAVVVPSEVWELVEATCELHECEKAYALLEGEEGTQLYGEVYDWYRAELQEKADAEAEAREVAETEAARQARIAERANTPRANLPLDERTGEASLRRWGACKGGCTVHFSLGMSASLLAELAEHCETEKFWFDADAISEGHLIAALRSALECIEAAYEQRGQHDHPAETKGKGWSPDLAAKFNAKGWRAKAMHDAMERQTPGW